MYIISAHVEFHLNGTCIWVASAFSILSCGIVIFLHLFRAKSYSVATLYACLIAICGVGSVLMEQTTFVQENVIARYAPDWLWNLRKLTMTRAWGFFKDLFPRIIDILIICDSMNRFILICHPDKKDTFMNWKVVSLTLFIIAGVSTILASLATQIHFEIYEDFQCCTLFKKNYTWVYYVLIRVVVGVMVCTFHLFFTVKIKIELSKSIAFLVVANISNKRIAAYKKIIKFSRLISFVLVFYNLLAIAELTVFVRRHILINYTTQLYIGFQAAASWIRNIGNILICLRPFFYSIIYTWLFVKRST